MASATPDIRLPSQPQSITALWAVPTTKLYCLVTEAHGYEQLAYSCYPAMDRRGVEPAATSQSQVQRPNHYTTEPPYKKCRSIFYLAHTHALKRQKTQRSTKTKWKCRQKSINKDTGACTTCVWNREKMVRWNLGSGAVLRRRVEPTCWHRDGRGLRAVCCRLVL